MQTEDTMNYDDDYENVRTKTRDKFFGRSMPRKSRHGHQIDRRDTHRRIKAVLRNRI